MITSNFYKNNLSIREKIFSLDFKLIFLILLLGIISIFAMYSTERGVFGYYTESHVYRFFIFFLIFILISFIDIKFWFKFSYLFYILVLILLIGVKFFGITASGSTRWINLFFINLQPSELMKVALIIFLARYYNRLPSTDVNKLKYLIQPSFALFIPATQLIIEVLPEPEGPKKQFIPFFKFISTSIVKLDIFVLIDIKFFIMAFFYI